MRSGGAIAALAVMAVMAIGPSAWAQQKLSCAYLRDKVAYCDKQIRIIRESPLLTSQERQVALQKFEAFRANYASQLPTCGDGAGEGTPKNDALGKSLQDMGKLFESLGGMAGESGDRAVGRLQELANRPLEVEYSGAGRRQGRSPGAGSKPARVDLDDLGDSSGGPAGPSPGGAKQASAGGASRCFAMDTDCLRRERAAIEASRKDAFERLKAVQVPPPVAGGATLVHFKKPSTPQPGTPQSGTPQSGSVAGGATLVDFTSPREPAVAQEAKAASEPATEEGACGEPQAARGGVRIRWTVGGSPASVVCPADAVMKLRSTNRPAACSINASAPCRDGTLTLEGLAPGTYQVQSSLSPWQDQPPFGVRANQVLDYTLDHHKQFCPRLVRFMAEIAPGDRARFPDRFALRMRIRFLQNQNGPEIHKGTFSLTFSEGMNWVGWMNLFPGRDAPNTNTLHLVQTVVLDEVRVVTDLPAGGTTGQWVSAQEVEPVPGSVGGAVHTLPAAVAGGGGGAGGAAEVCPTQPDGTFPTASKPSLLANPTFWPGQMGKQGITPVGISIVLQSN